MEHLYYHQSGEGFQEILVRHVIYVLRLETEQSELKSFFFFFFFPGGKEFCFFVFFFFFFWVEDLIYYFWGVTSSETQGQFIGAPGK